MRFGTKFCALMLGLIGWTSTLTAQAQVEAQAHEQAHAQTHFTGAASSGGLRFVCPSANLDLLESEVTHYLAANGIDASIMAVSTNLQDGTLTYQIQSHMEPASTLELTNVFGLDLRDSHYQLPGPGGHAQDVLTVSAKEILLALMHRARTNTLKDQNCSVDALQDEVGIRQSIVAWTELTEWAWPNGGSARWNLKYWRKGDLRDASKLDVAMLDAFLRPKKYAVGCYTASKMVLVQAYLDYYSRIRPNAKKLNSFMAALWKDGDPLINIEPERMWYMFADEKNPSTLAGAGKLVQLVDDVSPNSFIPGDWVYFLNTDPKTAQKTGYEGSNSIYMGRNRFDDYYNDNNHFYTYKEKIQEVYQWRNRVFSRSRDVARIHPLSAAEIARLSVDPKKGGLLVAYRATPLLFH